MTSSRCTPARALLLSAVGLTFFAQPLVAQEDTSSQGGGGDAVVSPEAQAVLDRMTAYLQGLQTFSISSDSTRDEVVAYGYKLQTSEHGELLVQRPNKLRAEIAGDVRTRTIIYDGAKLAMYSPDDDAYVRLDAPPTLDRLIGGLLDAGVEIPVVDVLYQGMVGTLSQDVVGGVLVGSSSVNGVECDQLAFRQPNLDWQLWVERGARPLPRKIVMTTRYAVGDPQFQAVLDWNLKPKIGKSTFVFVAPEGALEIPFSDPAAIENGAP